MDEQSILNGLGLKQVLGLAVKFQDPAIKEASIPVRDEYSPSLTRDQWAYYVSKAFPAASTTLFAAGNPNWWSVVHSTVSKAITYKIDLVTVSADELERIDQAEQNYNQDLENKPGSDDAAARTEAAQEARKSIGGGTQTPVVAPENVNPTPQNLPQPEEKNTEPKAQGTEERPSAQVVRNAEEKAKDYVPLRTQIKEAFTAGFEGVPSSGEQAPAQTIVETTTVISEPAGEEEEPIAVSGGEGSHFSGGGISPVAGMAGSVLQQGGISAAEKVGGKVFAKSGQAVATKVVEKGAEMGAKKAGGAVAGKVAAWAAAQFIPGLDVVVDAIGLVKAGWGLLKKGLGKILPGLFSKAKIGAKKAGDNMALGLGGIFGGSGKGTANGGLAIFGGGSAEQADSTAKKIVFGVGAVLGGGSIPVVLALMPVFAVVGVIILTLFSWQTIGAAFLNTTAQATNDPSFAQGKLFSVRKTAQTNTFANDSGKEVVYTVVITAAGSDLSNINVADTMTRENDKGSTAVTPTSSGDFPATLAKNSGISVEYRYQLTAADNNSNLVNAVVVTAKGDSSSETLTAQAFVTVGSPNYTDIRCPVAPAGSPCDPARMRPYFGDQAENASRICVRESGEAVHGWTGTPPPNEWGDESAVYDACTRGIHNEYSVGLFQINLFAHDSLCKQAVGTSPFTTEPFKAGCTYGVTCDACVRDDSLLKQCKDYWIQPDHNIQYAAQLFKSVGSHWYPTWASAGPKYCDIP